MRAARGSDDSLLVGGVDMQEFVSKGDARVVSRNAGHNGLQVARFNSLNERNLVDPAAEDENSIFADGHIEPPLIYARSLEYIRSMA